MGSLMKQQAERFLREKKRHRRWLAMFLCLALLVSSGTFAALRMNGQAMDEEGKVLACQYQVHAHGDECFDENGELICGQADYVVHEHSTDCYDMDGNLVCPLEEKLPHVHDSSCYTEEDVLTCELEESAGHQHTEECYGWDGAVICGQEESAGHQHTEECYSKESTLTCGELELHTHDNTCYDVDGNLICEKTELKEHVHNEECFVEVIEESQEAAEDAEQNAESENEVTQTGVEESGENYTAYDGESEESSKVKVMVRFPESEGLFVPENAQLFIEALDDEDGTLQKQAETYVEAEKSVTVNTVRDMDFYRIGFRDEDGNPIDIELSEDAKADISVEYLNGENLEADAESGKVHVLFQRDNSEEKDLFEKEEIVKTSVTENKEGYQEIEYSTDAVNGKAILLTSEKGESEVRTLSFSDKDYTVTVNFTEEAAIPENAELDVREIDPESEEYQRYYEQSQQAMDVDSLSFARFFDITFVSDGEEIEPSAPVDVQISYADDVEVPKGDAGAVHFAQDKETGEENPETFRDVLAEKRDFEFTQNSFSVSGTVVGDTSRSLLTNEANVSSAKSDLGEPEHNKSISANIAEDGSIDNYTLTLDVKGERKKKTIDIVLIIDASGSMKDTAYRTPGRYPGSSLQSVSRKESVEKAVSALIKETKNAKATLSNVEAINIGFVKFGTHASYQDFCEISQMNDNYTYTLYTGYDGGTNWQAAAIAAESLLSKAGADDEKYVVFLTDGVPTYRYTKFPEESTHAISASQTYYGGGQQDNDGKDRWGNEINKGYNSMAAKSQWKNGDLSKCTSYVVFVAEDCEDACRSFAETDGINAGVLNGVGEGLANTFVDIIKNLLTPSYKNVKITDQLSGNVEFASENPDAKDFEVVSIGADGKEETLDPSEYKLTINKKSKTFTLELLGGNELAQGVTYRVKTEVIPSETALTSFLNGANEYPDADEGGIKGFYTNINENAKVTYEITGEDGTKEAYYQKPVIQVDTTKRSINKEWKENCDNGADKVIVSLKAKIKRNNQWEEIESINEILSQHVLELTKSDNWKGAWEKLPQYYYYYDQGKANHARIYYIADEVSVWKSTENITSKYEKSVPTEEEQIAQWEQSENTALVIINSYKGMINVTKVWNGTFARDEIKVGLYKNDAPVCDTDGYAKVISLKSDNNWKESFNVEDDDLTAYSVRELENVPQPGEDTSSFLKVNTDNGDVFYKPIEQWETVSVNGTYYKAEYSSDETGANKTITNTPDWQLIKQSSSTGNPKLQGAIFELKNTNDEGKSYIGTSGKDGVVQWSVLGDENATGVLPENGNYILNEKEAPKGYSCSEQPWNITIENGVPTVDGKTKAPEEGRLKFYYNDNVVYELPETGGTGIYWYLVSGMLLMMAGALIIYRNNYKGVRER